MRLFLLILVAALSGCITPHPTRSTKAVTDAFRAGKFSVVFQAGIHTSGEPMRSFSYYRVERKFPTLSVPSYVAIESAHSLDHFQWNPKERPSGYIKFFLSASGDTMLIAEDIPNDCSPCTNLILVRVEGDEMSYDYLTLPMDETSTSLLREYVQITKISDRDLTYKLSDGTTRDRPFHTLKKRDRRPTFPG